MSILHDSGSDVVIPTIKCTCLSSFINLFRKLKTISRFVDGKITSNNTTTLQQVITIHPNDRLK